MKNHRELLLRSVCLLVAFSATFTPCVRVGWAAEVTADGRTATTIATTGAVTNVTTSTISQSYGINSFSNFQVSRGDTVNLVVPSAAVGTINLVTGSRSVIDGAVRSVQNGSVGGSLYFANSNGIVVGASGSIEGGAVHLSTPTSGFLSGFFGSDGRPNAAAVTAIVDGTAPQSTAGIAVEGAVRAVGGVSLRTGGDIAVTGEVTAGSRDALIAAAVNTGGVKIRSGGKTTIGSKARIRSEAGDAGGRIDIRAGTAIEVEGGARILAEGIGAGKGGTIDVFAGTAAKLGRDAVISASASGTGDGGAIEFSADESVVVAGLLQAASASGRHGRVLIDPTALDGSVDIETDVAQVGLYEVVASGTITLHGIHVTADEVSLAGGGIVLESGTVIEATGDVTLTARSVDADLGPTNALPIGAASITLDGATISGRDVKLVAIVSKDQIIAADAAVTSLAATLEAGAEDVAGVPGLASKIDGQIGAQVTAIADKAQAFVTEHDIEQLPTFLSAKATIDVSNSTITAARDVVMQSRATTAIEIAPEAGSIAVAVAGSNTVARTIVADSHVVAGRDVTVTADTQVTQTLTAVSNVPGASAVGLATDAVNGALAASFRRSVTEVVVTRDPTSADPSDPVLFAGRAVEIAATAKETISVSAEAVTNAAGRGIAIALSVDDADTTAALGAAVRTDSGKFALKAETIVEDWSDRATVTGGSLAENVATSGAALSTSAFAPYAGTLRTTSGTVANALGDDGTGTSATASDQHGVALALSNHAITTEALLGSTSFQVVDPSTDATTSLGLASVYVTATSGAHAGRSPTIDLLDPATGVHVTAATKILSASQAAAVSVDAGAGGTTSVTAANLAHWNFDTSATTGTPNELPGSRVEVIAEVPMLVSATNTLPSLADRAALDTAWDAYSTTLTSEAASTSAVAGWSRGEAPVVVDADGEETHLFSAVARSTGAGVGVGVDATIVSGSIAATAALGEGFRWRPNTIYDLSQDVSAQGYGTTPLSVTVTAANHGDLTVKTGATGVGVDGAVAGYGGALSIVDVLSSTMADVGDHGVIEGANAVVVSATQDMLVANQARAYGSTGGEGSVGGAIAVTILATSTSASLDAGATVGIFGDLEITARDTTDVLTLAGSDHVSTSSAIDFGVALTATTRETLAGIVAPDARVAGAPSLVSSLTIEAETSGSVTTIGGASAQSGGEATSASASDPTNSLLLGSNQIGDLAGDLGTSITGAGGASSIAISGDFAGTYATVSTRVELSGATVVQSFSSDASLFAHTNVAYGEASALTSASTGGKAISGAAGLNAIGHETSVVMSGGKLVARAVAGATPPVGGSDEYIATDRSTLDLVVAGTAGASDTGFDVSASATYTSFSAAAAVTLTNGAEASTYGDLGFSGGRTLNDVADFSVGRTVEITASATPVATLTAAASRDLADLDNSGSSSGLGSLFGAAGDATSETGGGLDGLSITVNPLKVAASATIVVEDSTVEADQHATAGQSPFVSEESAGRVSLWATAQTTVTIDTTGDTLAASVAITDTDALVALRNATISAAGNGEVVVASVANEVQDLSALSGTQSGLKSVGVLSVRSLSNQILIDAETGKTAGHTRITAPKVYLDALTTHNLTFTARATDAADHVKAAAAVVSLAESLTQVAAGGTFDTGWYSTTSSLDITARDTWTNWTVEATVSNGAFAEPGTGDENTTGLLAHFDRGDLADGIFALGERAAAENATEATDGNSTPWGRRTSFGLALALERHDVTTRATLGGTAVTPEGASVALLGGTATTVDIAAETKIEDISKHVSAKLANGAAGSIAGVGVLSFGVWNLDTEASVGAHGAVSNGVTVTATTTLPTVAFDTRENMALDDLAEGIGADFAEGAEVAKLGIADMAPKVNTLLHEGDWQITNETIANGTGADWAIDAGVHTFTATTRATIDDGASLAGGDVSVTATATGGITSARIAGDAGSTAEKLGVGGALQVLRGTFTTEAIVGDLAGHAASVGDITVKAENKLTFAADALSYGAAAKLAFNGAFTVLDYSGAARGIVDAATTYTANDLLVTAHDGSILIAGAAAANQGTSAGVGIASTLIFADREATAALAEREAGEIVSLAALPTTSRLSDLASTFASITLTATDDGITVATAEAGAKRAEDDLMVVDGENGFPDMILQRRKEDEETATALGEQTPDPAAEGDVTGKKFGFAISADYVGVFTDHATTALLSASRPIEAGPITVTATDSSIAALATGATVEGAGSVGLGGSFSQHVGDRATRAAVEAASVDFRPRFNEALGLWAPASLLVTATDSASTRVLSAGRAGETLKSSVLGSAASAAGDVSVTAEIASAEVLEGTGLTLSALRTGDTLVAAGALSLDDAVASSGESPIVPADEAAAKGVAIGVAFAATDLSETVLTQVVSTTLDTVPSPTITAKNDAMLAAVAKSSGGSNTLNLAGSAIYLEVDRATSARLDGGADRHAVSLEGGLDIRATDASVTRARIGLEGDTEGFGVGATAIVVADTKTVAVELRDTTVDVVPTGPLVEAYYSLVVAAENYATIDAEQSGGMASDTGIVGEAAVGIVTTNWTTSTTVAATDVTTDGSIAIAAASTASIRNAQGAMTDASKGAGTLGFASTQVRSNIAVTISDSSILGHSWFTPEIRDIASLVYVTASSDEYIETEAVRNGAADAALGVVFAWTKTTGSIATTVSDSDFDAQLLSIEATDRTIRSNTASAAATATALGAAGAIVVDDHRRSTTASVTGGTIGTHLERLGVDASGNLIYGLQGGEAVVAANSATISSNVAIGRDTGDGEVGFAGVLTWARDDRDVTATVTETHVAFQDATFVSSGSWVNQSAFSVSAERADTNFLLQATESSSSSAVGIGAGILRVGGDTRATLDRPTLVTSGAWALGTGALTVTAQDTSLALVVGLGGASTGKFGAVGSLAVIDMGRTPDTATTIAPDGRGDAARATQATAEATLGAEVLARTQDATVTSTARDTTIAATVVHATSTDLLYSNIVSVSDTRQAYAIAGQLSAEIVSPALDTVESIVSVDHFGADGIDLTLKGAGVRDSLTSGEGGDVTPVPTNVHDRTASYRISEDVGMANLDLFDASVRPDLAPAVGAGGLSIGFSLAAATIGGAVEAKVDVASGATVNFATGGTHAWSGTTTVASAVGSQLDGGVQLGASASLARQATATETAITGAGTLKALAGGWQETSAKRAGISWSVSGLLQLSGGRLAGGATFAANDFDNSVTARVEDATMEVGWNTREIIAHDASNQITVALAGGGSEIGVGLSIAVASNDDVVRTVIDDATVTGTGEFFVLTGRDADQTSLVLQAMAGGQLGFGAALAVDNIRGSVAAEITGSTLSDPRNVQVLTENISIIKAATVGVAVGGSASISGSMSVLENTTDVSTTIDDSSMTAATGSVIVHSHDETEVAGIGGGGEGFFDELGGLNASISASGALGVGVGLTIVKAKPTVTTLVTGDSYLYGRGSIYAASIGMGYKRGTAIIADADLDVDTLSITGSFAGQVAVSAQVPIVIVGTQVATTVASDASGSPEIASVLTLEVLSQNEADVSVLSFVGAGAGLGAVGADVEAITDHRTTATLIDGATLTGSTVSAKAISTETITTTSASLAGGAYAGVAGIVQVIDSESATTARVVGSTITARSSFTLEANATRTVTRSALGIGGGLVGVGGVVYVLSTDDTVLAEVASADGSASDDRTTLDVNGNFVLQALSTTTLSTTEIAGGLGLVALEGAISVTHVTDEVTARFGDWATLVPDKANAVTITASDTFTSTEAVGGGSIGLAGIGASVAVTSLASLVTATIGEHASLDSAGALTVQAIGTRTITSTVVSGGIGVAALQAAVSVVTFGESADEENSRGTLDDLQVRLASDPYASDGESFSGGDAQVAGLLTEARAGRSTHTIDDIYASTATDTVHVVIGDHATLDATDSITVQALEKTTARVTSGAGAIGALGFAAGVGVVRMGSDVDVTLDDHVTLVAGDYVTVKAEATEASTADPSKVTALAGGLALLSGAGAVAEMKIERDLDVTIGEGSLLDAGLDVMVRARETDDAVATATGLSLGFTAIGGTSATAIRASSLDIAVAEGAPTVMRGRDGWWVTLSIDRQGTTQADTLGMAGGAITLTGSWATARDTTSATLDLGSLKVDCGDCYVSATVTNGGDVTATASGGSVAFGSLGLTRAVAERNATTTILGADIDVTARTLDILAVDAASEFSGESTVVTADSSSATLGIGGFGGAESRVDVESVVVVDVAFSNLSVEGARVASITNTETVATTSGLVLAAIAAGANTASIESDTTATTKIAFDGAASVAETFTGEAIGHDDATGAATSGSGAIIQVEAAKTTVDIAADTVLDVSGAGGLTARDIVLRTSRDMTAETTGDSRSGSLVGFGATKLETIITSDSAVTIDTDLHAIGDATHASSVTIAAETTLAKTSHDYDGQIGSGGVLQGQALASTTTVVDLATIDVKPGTTITQTDATATPGAVAVQIVNLYDIADAVKIDTGGALLFPHAESNITVDTGSQRITFDGATIDARGRVTASIVTDATLANEVYVNAYGLAGAPSGSASIEYDGSQTIELKGTSILSREGDVVLAAGTAAGEGQSIVTSAENRIWNRTATPLVDDPDATADVSQTNAVTIDAASSVRAAEDVVITAKSGTVDPYAYGEGHDYWREGAEEVVNFFGGIVGADEVSYDVISSTKKTSAHDGVVVNGTVEAGAFAHNSLTIDAAGNATIVGEALDPVYESDVRLAATYETYRLGLILRLSGTTSDEMRALLTAELARIDSIISMLGSQTVDTVTIDGVTARVGDVMVTADYLEGSGTITAHGDASVSIINESPKVVIVGDVTIPFRDGGEVRFNGVPVSDATTIASMNGAATGPKAAYAGEDHTNPNLTIQAFDSDTVEPTVHVENRFANVSGGISGDILVTGTIENLKGTVSLATSDGNIMILGGSIEAQTVDISSAGDFLISEASPDAIVNAGGDPIGVYADFFDDYEAWVKGGQIGAAPAFSLAAASTTGITARGGVYIYARTINVDGLIQSGITDWDLTVTAGFDALLSAQTFASDDVQVVYSPDGGGSTLGERFNLVAGGAYVTGNMTLRYDPVGKTLLVDPIVTKGGHVELVGSIVSTGNGRIVAADGYGRVDVDSQSALPLIFDAVSTGVAGGVSGSIRIVDLDRPGLLPGTFVSTTYTKNDDGTTKVATNYGGGFGLSNVANATYAIQKSHAYEMRIGEVQSGTATKTVSDYVAVDGTILDSTESWSSTVDALASQPYTSASLTTSTGAVAAYTYGGSSYVLGPLTEVGQAHVASEDPVTWGNQTAVLRKTVTDYTYSGAIAYDTHTIAANLPIAIAFEGYASSRVNVSSKGDVIFSGTFLNRGGPTTVTSTVGSILTSSSSVVLETAKTTLTAAGDVGQKSGVAMVCTLCVPKGGSPTLPGAPPLEAMRIDQQAGTGLTVSAGGDVMISEVSGDMLVSSVVSTSLGAVTLTAAGSIRAADAAPLDQENVSGGALSLTALSGTIGAIDRPLFIDARDGLTASAAESISLHQNGHDLGLVSVVSQSGSVTIDVSGGSIVDVNTSETEDRLATSGLLEALWDELGLRATAADGSVKTRDVDAVASLVAAESAAYHEYWTLRGLDPVTSGGATTLVGRAYNANARVTLTTSDRARLVSLGKTDAEIAAIETALDTRYRALHARFGATTWDAAWTWTPPAGVTAQVTEGVFWTTNLLRRGIRRGLILDTTDTQLTIETPNVVGTDVTLTTDEGIGNSGEPESFTDLVGDAARNALWTAERSDIVVRRGQGFTVTPHEDVDVEASGKVTARAVDFVHLGSEGSVSLAEATAVGDVRVKVGGSLLLSPEAIGPAVTGKDIVLEAATGSIGTLADPMTLHQLADGSVSARAATGVHLEASGSSMRVGAIYSPADVTIVAGRSITDADPTTPIDISAGSIALVAGTGIGTSADALGLEQLDAEGRVDVLALTGDVHLAVPRGDLGAGSIGALLGATTIEVAGDLALLNAVGAASVHARDDLTLTVGGTVSGHGAEGIVDLRGGSLVLDAGAVASNGLHVAVETLAVETASGALHVVAEGDVTARRVVAGGGDVDLFATGALTLDGTVMAGTAGTPRDVVLTAGSGDLSGTLDRLAGSHVQLSALAGSVGTPTASLAVERAEVDLWSVMADRHIVIDITGAGIVAEKLVAATGGIVVAAEGPVVAGLVGSHDPAIFVTATAVHFAENGAAEPVASLPEVDGVVRAASYGPMTAEAGGVVHRQPPEEPQAVIDPGVAAAGAAPPSLDSVFQSVSNPSSPFIDLAAQAEVVVADGVAREILEETIRKRKKTTR